MLSEGWAKCKWKHVFESYYLHVQYGCMYV